MRDKGKAHGASFDTSADFSKPLRGSEPQAGSAPDADGSRRACLDIALTSERRHATVLGEPPLAGEASLSRSARLLALLQSLRRHRRPVTAATLADELGVSVRSIYRDIATLIGEGAAIRGAAGLGYVLERGFFLPPLMFELEELDAVMLGLRLVQHRGDPALAAAAENALAKVAAILPKDLDAIADGSGLVAFSRSHGQTNVLQTVRQAIRAEEKLELDYADAGGNRSQRRIWPVAIGFLDDTELLAAWCELRQDFRHFRLDRIQDVRRIAERLPRPHRTLMAEWRRLLTIKQKESSAS